MLFNSLHFMLFFPIVTVLYFVLPHKTRWVWLLGASYYFYMCWNPTYALLIATSTLITYMSGRLITQANRLQDDTKRTRYKKRWVALSFILNLLILFFFKYFGFAVDSLSAVLATVGVQLHVPTFDVMLPVGISFYTFQALSYTMDVYRGDIKAERNLGKYALFVSFFPQLVAGPIERSKNLLLQLHEVHTYDYVRMKRGLLLMLWGFFQKMVISDRVALVVNEVYNNYTAYQGVEIAVATVLFAIQIYCDFSGYSDIAIGAAEVMGFHLMDNFKRPYFAKSIATFWRRWHISLSSWFKDYLYIPLGGSRVGRLRRYRNILIVFMVSGLWHGASWTYVAWGFLHGMYQVVGDLLAPLRARCVKWTGMRYVPFIHKWMQMSTTFVLVNFAWIFFRAPDMATAVGVIRQLFSGFNPHILWDGTLYTLGISEQEFKVMLGAIGILWCVSLIREQRPIRPLILRLWLPIRWMCYFLMLYGVLLFGVYGPGYAASQFIYFQF